MKKYQASTPKAEVIGAALKAYEESIRYEDFKHILAEYNLQSINADQWYPQQLTLDVQKRISKSQGGSQALVSIGMKIIDNAKFPPMDSLEQAVGAFASSYPMNFRYQSSDDLIHAEVINDNMIKVINGSPHSDDMIYGYIYALIRRFSPDEANPIVKYENIETRDGDGNTVFNITY